LAIYSLRSTVYDVLYELPFCQSRLIMPRPVPPEGRWTDRHHLVSFYASDELRDWINEEVRRSGMSKTQVIVSALEAKRRKPLRRAMR
jgi:hypothetical protein